ncbi:hypothetical protein BN1184_AF_00420 [Pantoea ananatis]|nr:hypothetical protein BN1184_AF_00420 [Pantoea ananatis]
MGAMNALSDFHVNLPLVVQVNLFSNELKQHEFIFVHPIRQKISFQLKLKQCFIFKLNW